MYWLTLMFVTASQGAQTTADTGWEQGNEQQNCFLNMFYSILTLITDYCFIQARAPLNY